MISKPNRNKDIDLSIKVYTSPNLVPPAKEDQYIVNLFRLDQNYRDNLSYDLFPNLNNNARYNSNSYIAGILRAAQIPVPAINLNTPGYNKPIPINSFGVQK